MGRESETFQSVLPISELEAEQQLQSRRGPGRPPCEVLGKKQRLLSWNPSSAALKSCDSD